VWGRREREGR
jgi:hypothetical protein